MPNLRNVDRVQEIFKFFDVNKDKMRAKDISICWTCIAQIVARDRREREYLERNQEELQNMIVYTVRKLNDFKMVPFATTVVGIAKITKSTKKRWTAGTSVWKRFSELGFDLVDDMDAQGLSNVAWAFATLGHSAPSLFDEIAKSAVRKLDKFKPQALSNTAWAFATSGHPAPALFDEIADIAIPKLHKFEPQHLSNTAWAFAKVGHSAQCLFDGIAKFAIPKLHKFEPQHLSNTAWAFAKLEHSAPSLFDGISKYAIQKLDKFNLQALSNTALAFATIEHSAPALFDEIAKTAVRKLDRFNPQDFSNTAWAFATIGHSAPTLFDEVAKTAIPKLDKFKPQALSNTAWAFATVGHAAPSLFGGIAKNAIPKLDKFEPQALSNTAWAYAVFDHQGTCTDSFVLDKDFINACNSKASLFDEEGLTQLHQVELWFREQNSSLYFSSILSDKCRDAFLSGQKHAKPSELQVDVTTTLQEMNLQPEIEVLTTIGYSLDAVVTYKGATVGVEVDGPFHFVGREPNGSTILKRRQLEKLDGRPLLSIPYWEWNAVKKKDSKSNTGQKWRIDYVRKALGHLVD